MNKFVLAALVAARTASGVVYNAVDDPRCHDEPSRPVLEPTPSPSPYPPPPGEMREYEPPATTAPPPEVPCTGEVTGFQIYDLNTQATIDLVDQQTISLAEMPDSFTIKAVTKSDTLSKVELYLGDTMLAEDTTAPYLFGDSNFLELNTEGTYVLKGVGPTDTPGLTCSITISITYGNPHNCDGLIQQFALFDTDKQAIVPGYDLLENGEILKKSELPPNMSIIAIDNGRSNGEIVFGYENNYSYSTTNKSPAAISGTDANGKVLPWDMLKQKEYIRIRASSSDALGVKETKMCEISLQIEQDWACPFTVSGFALYYAGTSTKIPGYEKILGYRAVDLNKIDAPNGIAVEALSSKSGVQFFLDGTYLRTEGYAPYAMNGDNGSKLYEQEQLRKHGQFVIEAKHKNEGNDKRCKVVLTVQRDLTIKTIDNKEWCAPEAVVPEQVGNHMFASTPVVVTEVVTNKSVKFKTKNTIWDKTMGWVTTTFVTPTGYEVCDKIDNMAFNQVSEHTYEAKCFNGFAFADVYAYSDHFTTSQASADITMLHTGCKTAGATKVVKYTFVFSCDCDKVPDIPDEFIGGPNKSEQVCSGATAFTWGDPHVIPYNGVRSQGWNCQGEGEFVLSKAELLDYDYDFELRSRFTMFGQDLPWTFNSGMVAKQDVTVQLSMGEIGVFEAKPNMMDNVPIYFYVNGVPRYFTEGAGDPRLKVYVDGFHVYITFVTTGIQVHVQVRPFQSDNHSGIMNNRDAKIPGSFSTYLCLPADNDRIVNVKGLMGTPTPSMDDNFMKKDGTQIARPADSGLKAYCETEWCITNSADTMFTFETGKSFATYNKCGSTRRHLQVTEADVSQEILDICDKVERDPFCLEEGLANGAQGAMAAVEQILDGAQAIRDSQAGIKQDDDACCSSDYKTCIATCENKNKYFCDKCDPDAIWLPKGTYELSQGIHKDCVAKAGTCSSDSSCCPGLECSVGGTCVKKSAPSRRLEEFKMVRPDIPEERNIIPYHTEL